MATRKSMLYFAIPLFLSAIFFAQPTQTLALQEARNYSADIDGDGLSNETETGGWCNIAGCFTTDPTDADSDHDGLTDGEEKLFDAHPLDNRNPGIFVKHLNTMQTSRYYPWQQFGNKYIALATPGYDGVVVRRGTTFSIGGPIGATLEIAKSSSSLTTLTPLRDPCSGGWQIAVPANSTVGIYTLTIREGSWSKSLSLYVIFELPTGKSIAFSSAFVYDDNPNNQRDTSAIDYYELDKFEYDRVDYSWIPNDEWIAHGYAWRFNTQHYDDFIFRDHVMPTINGKTTTWDAGNALVQRVDDVTCFGNPRPLSSSWCVLNPSQCGPYYDNRNECSNIAGLLTAFNRSAGIPARPIFSDWIHSSFDHSTEIWTKPSSGTQNWYVARGYNRDEYNTPASNRCASPSYTGGNVKLRSTTGWYAGSSTQGVYAADENWPLNDIGGSGLWWDKFRLASWDLDKTARTAKIVKRSWWETRFRAYWGWPAEPTVTGTPPYDWPQLPLPPVAVFSAAPLTGTRPLTVTFTDQSTGHVRSRLWSFGDGITSTLPSLTHTYQSTGNFSVTLVITGAGGSNTAIQNNYIRVNEPPPVANFRASPNSGTWPLTVEFTDTSTGMVTSWLWDFGDGGTATVQNPTHTYKSVGNYNVSLTVTGPGGSAIETKTNYIRVGEPTPVADFTATPLSGTRPLAVTFTDASLGTITAWSWDFGDGGTSQEQNPLHTYENAGSYTVALTITGPGGSNTKTRTNYIQIQDQQAGSRAPASVDTSAIQFDAVVGESVVDLDGDGKADQLVFKIQVDVGKAGTYWFRGQLAGNRVEAIGSTYLAQGKHTIELPFSGQEIFMNKLDGPYTLQALWVTDVENPSPADFADRLLAFLSPNYKTRIYRYKDFGIAGAELSGAITHRVVDTDGDRYADTLIVETDLDIRKPGRYTVQGVLQTGPNKPPVTATWSGSTSKVILEFKGLRGTIGPYTLLGLHVRNALQQVTDGIKEPIDLGSIPELSAKRIILSAPSAATSGPSLPAPRFGITNTGYSDIAVDTDNDGRFDQLVITVGVQVAANEGGQAYRLEGWLSDVNDSLFAWSIGTPVTLTTGAQSLSLVFDGRMINEHQVNGPFTLVALKALAGSAYQVLDKVEVAYTTSSYDYTRFKATAIAPIVNVYADNLESGTAQWSATNPPWSLDTNVWFSRSHAWKASASGARTGALTLSNLNLANYAQPTLRFKTCYNMQTANDRGYLEASSDGVNWTRVNTYTNSTPNWTAALLDLGQWGKTSNLRLRFNANSQTGLLWYLDDLRLDGVPAVASATFTYSPQWITSDVDVNFVASYTSINTTLPITYTWNFGDGSPAVVSNLPTTSHRFQTSGNRTVQLTVENPYDRQTSSQTVIIGMPLSSTSFTLSPTGPAVSRPVTFTASFLPTNATQPVTYTWNFGDGTASVTSTQVLVLHTYINTGNYTATLSATNGYGTPVTSQKSFSVGRAIDSVSYAYSPAQPLTNATVAFTATLVPSNATQPITFTWNFGDGSSPVVSNQSTASHTFANAGSYTTTLTATNGYDMPVSHSKVLAVKGPVTDVSFNINPLKPKEGDSVTFTSVITPAGATKPVTYTWKFGDGSAPVVTTQNTTSHIFSTANTYTTVLTATNGYGSPVTFGKDILIGRAITSTSFTFTPSNPLDGDAVNFTATITPTSATQPVTYTWDFGDGNTRVTSVPTVSYTFSKPGTYTVRLTANNGYGSPANYNKSVTVGARLLGGVSFTVNPAAPGSRSQVTFTAAHTPLNATKPVTYTWNFGDGTGTVVTINPVQTHSFAQVGKYTVMITATNGYGAPVNYSRIVAVDNLYYLPSIRK